MRSGVTLVLGGIGVKGVASVGTLQALLKNKTKIKRIVAAGLSAVAAAQFALGRDLNLLTDHLVRFFTEHQRQLWGLERFSGIARSDRRRVVESLSYFLRERLFCKANFTRLSILSWDLIEGELQDFFGNATFSELRLPLAISAMDLKRGTEVLLEEGSLVDRLKAGFAFPGLFPPVRIEHQELVSSTLYCELPLGRLDEVDHPIVAIDIPGSVSLEHPRSIIDALARVDELRSVAIKRILLAKADRVFCLEGLREFKWVNYDKIPQLISQAYQEMDNLLCSCSDL